MTFQRSERAQSRTVPAIFFVWPLLNTKSYLLSQIALQIAVAPVNNKDIRF